MSRAIQSARFWWIIGVGSLAIWVWLAPWVQGQSVPPPVERPHPDGREMVGATACGDCHENQIKAWEASKHQRRYGSLHRSDRTHKMMSDLKLASDVRKTALCVKCHYSEWEDRNRTRVRAGVSCESCHSPAENWLKLHNQFGGARSPADETEANRIRRIAKLDETGMVRPGQLYKMAIQCFKCHRVAEERLVNVGHHPAGLGFELVAWFQGEVRHNLVARKGAENRETPMGRRRMYYVIGKAVDLELSLRGLANATRKGSFAKAMAEGVENAKKALVEIRRLQELPEVDAMLTALEEVELRPNNREGLVNAADTIAAAVLNFEKARDGKGLGGLDGLLPKPDEYKGTPFKP